MTRFRALAATARPVYVVPTKQTQNELDRRYEITIFRIDPSASGDFDVIEWRIFAV